MSAAVPAVVGGVVPELDGGVVLGLDDEPGLGDADSGYELEEDEPDDGLGDSLGYELDADELEELGGGVLVVSSSEDDEPVELEPAAPPEDVELPDDVPEEPMPPVVDEPRLDPELPIVLSLDAERVLPPDPSSVVAHAPSTSDAAASVEIASVLIRM